MAIGSAFQSKRLNIIDNQEAESILQVHIPQNYNTKEPTFVIFDGGLLVLFVVTNFDKI